MESVLSTLKTVIVRCIIVYFITSFFRRPAPVTKDPATGTSVASVAAKNLFPEGTIFTLWVYISENEHFNEFDDKSLFWEQDHLVYGDWSSGTNGDGTYSFEKEYPITEHIRNNGSLYLHVYVTRDGLSPDPRADNYAKNQFSYGKKMLNRYVKLILIDLGLKSIFCVKIYNSSYS